MKRLGFLLVVLTLLASACGVGPYRTFQATQTAFRATARAIQTQAAQANAVIAAQQTLLAATIQAMATLFTPAVSSPTPTPSPKEESVTTPGPTQTPMPTPTPEPLKALTFTTPKGIQVTLHRAWWALQVEDFTPTGGKVFLILDLTLYNPGEEIVQDYTLPLYATVHTAQGYLFRPVPLPLAQSLSFLTLAPRDRRRGRLVFGPLPR
ncbi:MAG TPA: hypothetical protein G4O04_03635 [Anaerolineae bacterium]|nr:hypothetical protein [Anaerolineae bacterium]HID84342.1 hypothetical protein [Anaerolineales bacterium]HIQ09538.1 hypothetical protein [Anaerolineaceae bacterium]